MLWPRCRDSAAHCPGAERCWCALLQSYAGKYVPSLSHFIVQMEAAASGQMHKLKRPRPIPAGLKDPLFKLGGVAIGNGWVGE